MNSNDLETTLITLNNRLSELEARISQLEREASILRKDLKKIEQIVEKLDLPKSQWPVTVNMLLRGLEDSGFPNNSILREGLEALGELEESISSLEAFIQEGLKASAGADTELKDFIEQEVPGKDETYDGLDNLKKAYDHNFRRLLDYLPSKSDNQRINHSTFFSEQIRDKNGRLCILTNSHLFYYED